VWEVDEIEFAIGSEGVVDAIEEGSCEFEVRIACAADNGFAFVAGVEKLLLFSPLQQLFLKEAKSDPIPYLPALV
jgi:hypothetical protein